MWSLITLTLQNITFHIIRFETGHQFYRLDYTYRGNCNDDDDCFLNS